MNVLSFLLYYLVIIPISLLPFRILYLFSDFLYLVLYKVAGYRKKVVRSNLRNSLPGKSESELINIEREFYHHFCDVIVETFKSFTISRTEINQRMVMSNPSLPDAFFDKGQSILLAGGHYNNWEWFAVGVDQQIKHQSAALYTPLRNAFFDRKMRSTRGRFGLQMISVKNAGRFFENPGEIPVMTVFGIDQSPRNPNKCHWMTFLNQDTGVMYGLEKYARQLNAPVVFGTISKIKRGYYETTFSLVTDDPQKEPPHAIIERATRMLEADIMRAPSYWLWTHRRWKRTRPADWAPQTVENAGPQSSQTTQ